MSIFSVECATITFVYIHDSKHLIEFKSGRKEVFQRLDIF